MKNRSNRITRRALLSKITLSVPVAVAGILAGIPKLSAAVSESASRLRSLVSGTVVEKGDAGYESWRRNLPWQPYREDIHERYPALIAQIESEDDVIAAVKIAREQGLKIAIKSGGHSESGAFLRDGSLLIDLSMLQEVKVDPKNKTFEAQPGVWSRNLAEILRRHDLAFPVAHNATVPLGGYILAGGHGLNPDAWGTFACFNILAADVVTADGELVHCDADNHPDLFWAVRGAGPGFFGIVTRFYLKAYDYPKAIRSSTYVFHLKQLPEVVSWAEEVGGSGIAKTELLMALITNPDAKEDSPEEERFLCIFNPVTFADSEQEAQAILTPVAAHSMAQQCLFKEELQPSSFDKIYQRSYHEGFGRHSSDTMWTNSPIEAAKLLVERFPSIPSPSSAVTLAFRTDPILREDAAASIIGSAFVACYSSWESDNDSNKNVTWARETIQSLKSFSAGHYINEVNALANPQLVPECFSPQAWKRLHKLRKQYDPQGLFYDYPGRA